MTIIALILLKGMKRFYYLGDLLILAHSKPLLLPSTAKSVLQTKFGDDLQLVPEQELSTPMQGSRDYIASQENKELHFSFGRRLQQLYWAFIFNYSSSNFNTLSLMTAGLLFPLDNFSDQLW